MSICFLKYKKVLFPEIENNFEVFVSGNIRQAVFSENIISFLMSELEASIYLNTRKYIFLFFELGLKKCARRLFLQNVPSDMFDSVQNMPRVLNIPGA